MSCCKTTGRPQEGDQSEKSGIWGRLLYFFVGIIVITIAMPVIFVAGIVLVFNAAILEKGTEISPTLHFIMKIIYKSRRYNEGEDDEEDDEDEEYNPEDYQLLDYEEIKPAVKNE